MVGGGRGREGRRRQQWAPSFLPPPCLPARTRLLHPSLGCGSSPTLPHAVFHTWCVCGRQGVYFFFWRMSPHFDGVAEAHTLTSVCVCSTCVVGWVGVGLGLGLGSNQGSLPLCVPPPPPVPSRAPTKTTHQSTTLSFSHAFTVCIHTENQNQGSFYPFVLHEISVLIELPFGHPRYLLADVPPQPNSPSENVFNLDRRTKRVQRHRRGGVRSARIMWNQDVNAGW